MNIENPQTLQMTSECIKEAYRFTHREVINVCTGATSNVPNGFWDYMVNFFLLALFTACLWMFIKYIILER